MNKTDYNIRVINEVVKAAPFFSNVYLRGSYCYGSNDDKSDLDLFIVPPKNTNIREMSTLQTISEIYRGTVDIDFCTYDHFMTELDSHAVPIVEMHLLESAQLTKGFDTKFVLSKPKLRSSFSHVASNSWVKAKKKLTVEADFDERIAKKSLFHSFRILSFGIHIAEGKKIIPSVMNHILDELNSMPPDWELIDSTFRKRHNEMHSHFKKICPKE